MRTARKESYYKSGFQANLDGWTKIRNYGDGGSTLKIRFGKKNPRLWQNRMVELTHEDSNENTNKIIINIDELEEVLRYG